MRATRPYLRGRTSATLNSALALGSQGTLPSREQGGLGMYQGLAFLHLMGKVYIGYKGQTNVSPFFLKTKS